MRQALCGASKLGLALASVVGLGNQAAVAQQGWQPNRIPPGHVRSLSDVNQAPSPNVASRSAFVAAAPGGAAAQAIPSRGYAAQLKSGQAPSSQTSGSEPENRGGGVVFRWRESANATTQPAPSYNHAEVFSQSTPQPRQGVVAAKAAGNPLRHQTVRYAAYQSGADGLATDPFADDPPTAPQVYGGQMPALPGSQVLPPTQQPLEQVPSIPDARRPDVDGVYPDAPQRLPETIPPAPAEEVDPLAVPEAAPAPQAFGDDIPQNPLQDGLGEDVSPRDAQSDQREPAPFDFDKELPELNRSRRESISCNELRERGRLRPLSEVVLDVSPRLGGGIHSADDSEEARSEFEDKARVRDWYDYAGQHLITGRMIDLRLNRVIIESDGVTRSIPFIDLSDVDVEYVSRLWNIPGTCGTGFEPRDGRDFIPSHVQWAAAGMCHKPLYFDSPQLERYGHEVGPVLQPLISSAHFFGTIGLLPYKMGIHPPGECQYPLGYIRPGNCAPYMMQPFPLSLRGAAVQAGVVTGAAALIP